jgi:lysophospholipase L1-like esterase
MPMDPLSTKKISDATRENYLSYVNSLGVPYYDFQRRYPSRYFHDLSHMNVEGRIAFSQDIAQIIKKEVEK